jgi:hypothetical protein
VLRYSNNTEFLQPDTGVGFQGALRPNLTGQPFFTNASQQGTSFQLVNPAAFSAPPNYQSPPTTDVTSAAYRNYYADPLRFFGNAPPVIGPARFLPFGSEDFSVLKKTRITETVAIELRAELLNAFNRHRYFFGGDQADFRSGTFGQAQIDTGFRPRNVQLGLRLIF